MTNNNESIEPETPLPDVWTPETDPDGYTREDVTIKDLFLDWLFDFFFGTDNAHRGSFGLTLQVKGATVSGTAISRGQWVEEFISTFRENAPGDVVDQLEKLYTMVHDNQVAESGHRSEAGLPTASRQFLHMRDVKVFTGDTTQNLPLWRGHIDTIDGWSMGSFTKDD